MKSNKCKCPSKKRFVSHGICNHGGCLDVCTTPLCGTPDQLTLLAPVVYDEIGINLCRNVPLTDATDIIAANNIVAASIQIVDINFNIDAADTTEITQISGRPNCYLVNLTNLSITFAVTLYNRTRQVISTLTETVTYLPPTAAADGGEFLDEDTNPTNVELEIFAPYGVSYQNGDPGTPVLNYIGFSTTNNMLVQGLNLIGIPKILNFDLSTATLTLGITLYLKSVYFSQYLLPHNGRAVVPKGTLVPDDDTLCMDFVCGDLLDYDIKPLELGPPKFESTLKQECTICDSYGVECCAPITFATDLTLPVEDDTPPEP